MEIRTTTSKPVGKRPSDIEMGTVFQGRPGSEDMPTYDHSTYLKCYVGIVDLERPSRTWGTGSPPLIHDYVPVHAVLEISALPL